MRPFLDRFILAIPVLLIKQFPYAWIAAVVFWSWPPTFSIVFLAIVALGLLMLRWQSLAWLSTLKREHTLPGGRFHVDESPVPWMAAARRIVLLLIGAAGLAWLLNGQLGLGFWQFFWMIFGFTLLYQDTRFFGAPATYAITDEGIGIRFVSGHLDYRLFLLFKEISRLEKREFEKDKHGDFFARTRDANDGLLLIPRDPNGFTKRIEKLYIVPKDPEGFLEQLPPGYR